MKNNSGKQLFRVLSLGFGLMASYMALGADDFSRLFTTPAERASLDNIRRTSRVELLVPEKIEDEQPQEAAPVLPPPVSVQGYVKRNDGKQGTVWVNNTPVQENASTEDVQVGKLQQYGNQVPIKLKGTGKSVRLKAGQVYEPEADNILETSSPDSNAVSEISGKIGDEEPFYEITKRSGAARK